MLLQQESIPDTLDTAFSLNYLTENGAGLQYAIQTSYEEAFLTQSKI